MKPFIRRFRRPKDVDLDLLCTAIRRLKRRSFKSSKFYYTPGSELEALIECVVYPVKVWVAEPKIGNHSMVLPERDEITGGAEPKSRRRYSPPSYVTSLDAAASLYRRKPATISTDPVAVCILALEQWHESVVRVQSAARRRK